MNSHSLCRGTALVFVLAIIVLIAGLVVAYLLTATHAVRTAAIYRNDVAAQQLAETAVNVVIGQIADGSHTAKQGAPDEGLVWTSQPGLIRTYDTAGRPYRFYKLYSSPNMVVEKFPGDYWSPEEKVTTEVPDDWYEHRGLFTDLNEPVLMAFDPSIGPASASEGAIRVNGAWHHPNYPIADPAAQLTAEGSRDGVEGFVIDAERLSSAPRGPPPAGYNPTLVTDPSRSPNPAPMPVRWLYVLRDGRLTAPEGSSRGANGAEEVSWTPNKPSAPTRHNPVVGRIAFWADDETCKLNINTASEGTFWDRAIVPSWDNIPPEEMKLYFGKPRSNEWQRTPGHPAMTCLSPVFGMLPDFRVPLSATYPASDYLKFAAIYNLVPRVGTAGTAAGTWTATGFEAPVAIKLDQDRLFASLDEVLFAVPQRNGASRQLANPQITRGFLEKAKFFLTTSNRAPETNVFNRPRISLWPVQQEVDPNKGKPDGPNRPRTILDDKLAACATLNKQSYFFQRYSTYVIGDINDQYKHPDNPFGQQADYVPPSSQRADLDWKISRNHELYRYLQDLTQRPIPGLAGRVKFSNKLGSDRDQLLTTMVDYLRLANNCEPSNTVLGSFAYSPAFAWESPKRISPTYPYEAPAGAGQIVPLVPPPGTPGEGTKGLGRFPTITEAVLVLFRVLSTDKKSADQLGAVLLLQTFSPNGGAPDCLPLVRICIRGLDAFSINGQSLEMPPIATSLLVQSRNCAHGDMVFTCSAGTYYNLAGLPKKVGSRHESDDYPFYSRVLLPLAKNIETLQFNGGSLSVEIHAGYYGKPSSCLTAPRRESLVQTLQFDFPAATFPVPVNLGFEMENLLKLGPLGLLFHDTPMMDMWKGEVRRSIQVDPDGPTRGDLRLLAAIPTVPANYFHPHPDYFSSKLTAHSMRSYGMYLNGATDRVELEPGVVNVQGIAANGLHGALLPGTSWPGDWDSGFGGLFPDGAQYWHPDTSDYPLWDNRTLCWSPLRQLPSPVVFGSLPIGVNPKNPQPWRTLLFCANPASGNHHPGWQQPRDHYLLDFFQMPVVEPYAISAPLATSGKVNLNCQIAPFTYIRRDTALRGAFRGTKVTTSDNQKVQRLTIDANETLKGFQRRFADKGGCFKTASELCEMFLVPEGAKLEDMKDGDPDEWWWKSHRGTGDNLRENPYSHLYCRVTARSDTFTVHYRVQILGHHADAHPNVWNEGSDSIVSEARGSTLLERYVDPDDPHLRDFATDPSATLDDCYKFRVIRTQPFGR